MPEYVDFLGLHHYPLGNAQLRKKNDTLVITELSRPMDGIAIATGTAKDVTIKLVPLELKNSTVLAITFHATDNMQRMKSIGQWAFTKAPDSGVAYLMFNSRLEGDFIELTGKRNKTVLFRDQVLRRQQQWITAGSFDLTNGNTWLSDIDCRVDVLRDGSGKVIKVTTTKTIHSNGIIRPVRSKQQVSKRNSYAIDALRIVSTTEYPKGLPVEQESYISQVSITGQDMSGLVLTHSIAQ